MLKLIMVKFISVFLSNLRKADEMKIDAVKLRDFRSDNIIKLCIFISICKKVNALIS